MANKKQASLEKRLKGVFAMYAPIKIVLMMCAVALPVLIEADTLTKLSEVKRGEISELSIAGLNSGASGLFVTAVRDSDRNLRVLVWANDETEPRAVKTAGTIKEVATTSLTGKRFVTAVRDDDDRLRVIAWQANADGRSIERLGTAIGPKIRKIAVATAANGDVVFIAARRFDRRLMVGFYEVVRNSVNPKGRETYSEVSTISASMGITNTAAMRDSEGKLRLIHFWNPLSRGGTVTGGDISDVRITSRGGGFSGDWFTFSIDEGPSGVRTSLNCLSGRLLLGYGRGKIIGWKLKSNSIRADFERTREKQLTDFGGIAKKADLAVVDDRGLLITGHLGFDNFCRLLPRDQGKPRVQLTVWDLRDDDAFVKAAEAHLGGDYTEIGITKIAASGNQQRFAVALRGVGGELKVTVWGINPD